MTKEEALTEWVMPAIRKTWNEKKCDEILKALAQEPCEMTAEEYRQKMIQAFHNADHDELIAICVLPTEKEFEHLEWLLKNHYKKEPCENEERQFFEVMEFPETFNEFAEQYGFTDKEEYYTNGSQLISVFRVKQWLEHKALEQEPCENWYDIPSDEMTLEQARQAVKDLRKMWAERLEQEPCGKDINVPATDAISRQAALDTFGLSEKSRKYGGDHSGYDTIMLYEVQDALEALPSVQPQPKTGHWIKDDVIYSHCSECGRNAIVANWSSVLSDYCPNCGAKMEVSDEEKH